MPKFQRKRREKDEKAWQKKQKKKICQFCKDKVDYVDYKDVSSLRKYVSERGKIRSRRVTGNCVQHQRDVAIGRQERPRDGPAPVLDAMKVILQHEVDKLGAPGDLVDVKDGYARNFLIPRGMAVVATKGGARHAERLSKAHRERVEKARIDAEAVAAQLTASPLRLTVRAGRGRASSSAA